MQDLTCTKCRIRFDRVRFQPRLFPFCGHTFCTECIEGLIRNQATVSCPEDGRAYPSFDPVKGLDCFPVNVALMNLLAKATTILPKEERREVPREIVRSHFCKHHHKLADLICLTDKKIICSKCALFGDHKNHDIREIEDFKQLVRGKVSEFGSELERLRKPAAKLQTIEAADSAMMRGESKKRELYKTVEEACQSIKQELARREIQAKEQIDAVFGVVFEEVGVAAASARTLLQRREVLSKKWERASLLLSNQEVDFDFFLELFFGDNEAIGQTEKLFPEMEAFDALARNQLEQRLQNVAVVVSAEDVKGGMAGLFRIDNRPIAGDSVQNFLTASERKGRDGPGSFVHPQSSLLFSDQIKQSHSEVGLNDIPPVRDSTGVTPPQPTKVAKVKTESTVKGGKPKGQREHMSIQSISSTQRSHHSAKRGQGASGVSKGPGDDHSDIWPTEHRADDSSMQDADDEEGEDGDDGSFSKIAPDRNGSPSPSQGEEDGLEEDEEAFDGIDDFKQVEVEDPILHQIPPARPKKNSSFLKANNNRPAHQRFPSNTEDAIPFPHLRALQDEVGELSGDVSPPVFGHMLSQNKRPSNPVNFQSAVQGNVYPSNVLMPVLPGLKGNFESHYDTTEPQFSGRGQRMLKRGPMTSSALVLPTANSVPSPILPSGSQMSGMHPNFALPRASANQFGFARKSTSKDYEYVDASGGYEPAERLGRRDTSYGAIAKAPKVDDEFEIDLSSKSVNLARLPELLKAIAKNRKAKILNLSYNYINEKGVELVLDKLAGHPSIEVVIFNGNAIDESIFDLLVKKGKVYAKRVRTIVMKDVKTFRSLANIKKQINILKRLNIKVEI